MRKLFFATILIACATSFSFAQSNDYNKYEIYGGFSHSRVDFGDGDYEGFNGFEVAATGNVSRYIGIKGDYAFHFKSFDGGLVNVDARTHTLVGGVQIKDNSTETKFKPFAHLMAGFQHARINNIDSDTGFAGVIGGGIDIRVSPRVDFRAIQFDYNPTRLGDGGTQHNFRIGVGIVFR